MSKALFDEALKAEGVSGKLADLARSIYTQESGGGKNTKTSYAGAKGGMQVIPATFARVADKDWSNDNPEHNARAGIRYLKLLDKKAGGDARLTAIGYVSGEGGIDAARKGEARYHKDPSFPNSFQYADKVVSRMGGGTPGSVGSGQSSSPGMTPAAPSFAAAPSAGGQPVKVAQAVPAPVVSGGGDAAPVVVEQAGQAAPAESPEMVALNQANAWQEFLKAMPRSQPVNTNDIDYSNPRPAMAVPTFQFQPQVQPARQLVPNFQAFSSWGGWKG